MAASPAKESATLDIEINRLLRSPRAKLWRAWSDPALLREWWCPRPWSTEVLAFEFQAGGAFHTLMTGPDGGRSDNPGCFLEVVPGARIVFTSMLLGGWRPATPWMGFTASIALSDEGAGTRYVARIMHPDEQARRKHSDMGCVEGWNIVMTQLDELAASLH